MLTGEEEMAYLPLDKLTPVTEYDAQRDIQFFSGTAAPAVLHVPEGLCYVVLPEDGHMPCRCAAEPSAFTKLVVKLLLEPLP